MTAPQHPEYFFILAILSLATILAVVGMRQFGAARRARLESRDTVNLRTDIADLHDRIVKMEKLLSEVA